MECQKQEKLADRIRKERWGPRTLDVDLLWIDGEVIEEENLTVPHPRMKERGFVLIPLRDLDPTLVDSFPNSQKVISGDLDSVIKIGTLLDETLNGK